jgi:hypothetical protein
MTKEWVEWHSNYDNDPTLRRRLAEVQLRIREALDRAPPGPIRIISACSGDGRDLLGVLEGHARAPDVRARLVELDPELVKRGRYRASTLGLLGVEFQEGDAGQTSAFEGAVPADLVLLCGIFGNVTADDLRNTVAHAVELCAPGATVIWTRGRFEPDLTPTVRAWFERAGFRELSFVTIEGSTKAVGSGRLAIYPRPFRPGVRLFTFLPETKRPSRQANATSRRARPKPPSPPPKAKGVTPTPRPPPAKSRASPKGSVRSKKSGRTRGRATG